jgi:AcrR family transcriptional regulator
MIATWYYSPFLPLILQDQPKNRLITFHGWAMENVDKEEILCNYKSNVRLKKLSLAMAKPKSPKKSKEIHGVVARLFAHRGYHHTSMREIAWELGMNQSSLYHYFSSKEDVLFRLMNDAMDHILVELEKIYVSDLSAEDKLKRVLHSYIHSYAGDQERLILLVNEMNALTETNRLILVDKQRKYVQLIKSILKELVNEEKMRDIDPAVTTFAFFGMVHYTIKWYHKDGPITVDQLAKLFVEIFTRGILQ